MALEPGVVRIRRSGSAGGHNGLADIIEKAGKIEGKDSEERKRLVTDAMHILDKYFLDHPYEYFGKRGKPEDGGSWWLDDTETVVKFIKDNKLKFYKIFL